MSDFRRNTYIISSEIVHCYISTSYFCSRKLGSDGFCISALCFQSTSRSDRWTEVWLFLSFFDELQLSSRLPAELRLLLLLFRWSREIRIWAILDCFLVNSIVLLRLFKFLVLFDRIVDFRQHQAKVWIRREHVKLIDEFFLPFLGLCTSHFRFLQLLLEHLLFWSNQSVGVLDGLVIMLWVIWIEPVIIRYKLVVRLLLFLWALPLPGARKDFIGWHEYSHPYEKPCSVGLFLLAVSDRSFVSIKFFLTRHGLITRNCFHEELLQLLQQELLVRPWEAFGNICYVMLLGTEEVSLLDFHHELERTSSWA